MATEPISSAEHSVKAKGLERLDVNVPHTFDVPKKMINAGSDLSTFLESQCYQDILSFVVLLNHAMFPKKTNLGVTEFKLKPSKESFSDTVASVRNILHQLDQLIEKAPPDPGPRRFGNVSFRKWHSLLEDELRGHEGQANGLIRKSLPSQVVNFNCVGEIDATAELEPYLLGAFGSSQRLDYGTGHELSFLAFLAGIWKLGGFCQPSDEEAAREIVLWVIEPYLVLVRKLILTYNLEPAGSHGVWGLDDHAFVPYIFGSAQYGPAISEGDPTPLEGSLPGAPDPGDVAKAARVKALRDENMYFGAIGFIYDVKTGPFWEHSPTLYDISGVRAGWGKINKGMMKMYNAEVLSKFPVIQHFPLGSLFKWDRSPNAPEHKPDIHARSQPQQQKNTPDSHVPGPIYMTSTMQGAQAGLTRAPWAQPSGRSGAPPTGSRVHPSRGVSGGAILPSRPPIQEETSHDSIAATKAPWAK